MQEQRDELLRPTLPRSGNVSQTSAKCKTLPKKEEFEMADLFRAHRYAILMLLWLPLIGLGCSSSSDKGGGGGGDAGGPGYIVPGSTGGTSGVGSTSFSWPPTGFINVTNVSVGAYALGPQVSSSTTTSALVSSGCGQGVMYGVVRDFKMYKDANTDKPIDNPAGHIDFQDCNCGDDHKITTATLGPDGKPVYASATTTNTTFGAEYFNQWYNDVPGVNMTYVVALQMVQKDGVVSFSASINNPNGQANSSFFPLDGQGFGNETTYLTSVSGDHNFSFTTEIHTGFTYNGGETFTFKGDDDVWVYINDQKVIDLGGMHSQEVGTVNLDTLGLQKGQVYPMAIFNAERHTNQSNFRVDTTLAFTDCGQVDGVIIN